MLKKIVSYILTFVVAAFVLISLGKHYVFKYGNIQIAIQYESLEGEDITLYWNKSKGFSAENKLSQTTRFGEYLYEYEVRDLDSLLEIRIDPYEKIKYAIIKKLTITGLQNNFELTHFEKCSSSGLVIYPFKNFCLLKRITNNNDPYIKIKIPKESKYVLKKFESGDIILITICLMMAMLLSYLLTPSIIKRFSNHTLLNTFLFFFFVLIVSSHWTNLFLKFYPSPANLENRRLAQEPNVDSILIQPKQYFKKYDAWFTDHFDYRQILVKANSYLRINLFQTSPIPNAMFIGKNFEFYSGNDLLIDDVTGKRRLNEQEMNYIYQNLKIKYNTLKDLNIGYYVTMPPSKQTVYEDLLPSYLRKQAKSDKMAKQLGDFLVKNSVQYYVNVIDILKQRHQYFPKERVFYQYDIHWSERGAFFAYQILMNNIRIKYPWVGNTLQMNDIKLDTVYTNQADLAKLILLSEQYKKETYEMKFENSDSIKETIENGVFTYPVFRYYNPKAVGKVLVYRDSYSEQWKKLIAHHFRESTFIWDQNIRLSQILEYKPDIIIQENCEMFLFDLFKPIILNEKK